MTFQPLTMAVRVVMDRANARELSRGLVEVMAVYDDGRVLTSFPPEVFAPTGETHVRVAMSQRTARDVERLVTLEIDPGPGSYAEDRVGLQHVGGAVARVLSSIPRPNGEG